MRLFKLFIKKHHRVIFGTIGIFCIIFVFLFTDLKNYRIIKNPQYDYASFLIENNDKLMELIIDFERKIDYMGNYTEKEKETLSSIVIEQNKIIEKIEGNPPNESNDDFEDIYDTFLKSHAFYIQGQIMKLENVYNKEHTESLIMGTTLTDVIGNIVYRLSHNINLVRSTDIPYTYGVAKEFKQGSKESLIRLTEPEIKILKEETEPFPSSGNLNK